MSYPLSPALRPLSGHGCPPGDDRGKVYVTTNVRTNGTWILRPKLITDPCQDTLASVQATILPKVLSAQRARRAGRGNSLEGALRAPHPFAVAPMIGGQFASRSDARCRRFWPAPRPDSFPLPRPQGLFSRRDFLSARQQPRLRYATSFLLGFSPYHPNRCRHWHPRLPTAKRDQPMSSA